MNSRIRNILIALVALLVVGGGTYLAIDALRDGEDRPDGGTSTPTAVDIEGEDGGIRLETAGEISSQAGPAGEGRLQISLSRGEARVQQAEPLPLAAGTPLPPEEVEAIIRRLPTLSAVRGDTMELNLPDELLPPPRPGETVGEPFPPQATPIVAEPVPEGPLEVLRFAPEGEIGLAPFLNVTFNQPMVPLNTVDALSREEVPVQLTPAIPGTWRWLGTRTLSFEYESDEIDRFPMATEYVAEVPAGTESAVGGVLAETVTWKFRTPPPQIQRTHPGGESQPRDPIFFVVFDQQINPAAVLETIQVTAGGQPVAVRLATQQEVEADERASRLLDQDPEGYWLAFRATETLPADSEIRVTIGPGTPSAEGPLTTEEAQTYSFRTYGALRILEHSCGWGDECAPFTPFFIRFSNALDGESFSEAMLQIEPEIPGAVAGISGRQLTIRGATEGRTTYEVTVDGSVQDVFGQTLGESQTLRFDVGSARPQLSGPNQALVTLDPSSATPRLTVYSVNYDRLEAKAYAVTTDDWPAYQRYLEQFYRSEELPVPPGELVLDETISVDGEADALTETNIDLSEALAGETGHLIVVVQPPRGLLSLDRSRPPVVRAWVQVTQIGLDAFVDQDEMVAWATDLATGAPLEGVALTLGEAQASTGADGLARLSLPAGGAGILLGRQGDDVALLTPSPGYWDERAWQPRPDEDELRWYVWDDRQMYRPGEEVHVKGWLRRIGAGPQGDVGLPGVEQVTYLVRGPQGNEYESGQLSLNALGGFDFALTLPENANLGYATVELRASGGGRYGREYYHNFQIQEFRRPEFEVTARQETEGPYFVGDAATVAVEAAYFAGGPLPNAEVTWQVTSSPADYDPPGWPEFTFGTWQPWWRFGPVYEMAPAMDVEFGMPIEPYPGGEQTVETFSGVTDASGNHYLNLDFDAADEPRPFSVRAEATVMDVNRQAWAANTNLLVHPGERYVGLRSERTFVQKGTPLEIALIVTGVDGEAIAGQAVTVEAARLEWRFTRGRWGEEEVDVQTCEVSSAAEPVTCTFATDEGGTYQITATVVDAQGRENRSTFTRWVSGGRRPQRRNVEQEELLLVPDKEEYRPGDTAEILVQAPFSPAEGLLTVSRSGILYTEEFSMAEGSTTLRVPIEDAHVPTLHVQVDLVGSAPRTTDAGEPLPDLPARPAYAQGSLALNVPPYNRTLSVEVAPQEAAVAPGAETAIDVLVTGANGEPVGDAEVALVVVDEAILALTNYQLADPLGVFYRDRGPGFGSYYGRRSIVLANPELLATVEVEGEMVQATRATTGMVEEPAMAEAEEMAMDEAAAAPMDADGAAQNQAAPPIQVRTDFNPLAVFAPEVRTGGDGRATVQVSLPDNLTRYRVMAVAVAGEKEFGQGESNLRARLPLMVRPSAPRFLNFGDRFGLPVVVQNQTDQEMVVDVVVQATNLELIEGNGRRVTVPANDRVEVRFPAETARPGTARLQFAAISGDYADAASISLPVYTPATTEAFATYGVLDAGAVAQPVAAPEGVFPQFGGLEVNTSSTALQALTDAVLYLVNYRYECSEQLASRILAVAALRDVLTAFEAEGMPTPAEMEAAVQRDLERLQGMQNGDGGFPVWRRGQESRPFYSIHVTHALVRAQEKGFAVPQDTLLRAIDHLAGIEEFYPSYYPEWVRQTLSAYALNVRYLAGDVDAQKALSLYNEGGVEELPLESLAWLWPVLDSGGYQAESEAIARHFNNRAVETAGAANFTTSYDEDAYLLLHSNRRTDGIILDALIAVQPESDLIPKVVNGLLAHRTRGRWGNTQENVFILLALDKYFNTFEAETPDFVARIWLGETYAGEHQFEGRTTERRETEIPMSYLVQAAGGETQDLILSKEGPGRLYYRLGLSYAPDDLELEPLDMGFIVERVYEAVDDPADVSRDEDGTWHIRAGARVRVKLKMVADNRRYHVALVDPLPAGLEIVNPALAVSEETPADPAEARSGWWWWWTWYDHQNMRDERAEAFSTLLWEGVYDYEYVARATTPGTFVVPPAKAEEMYSPEVFGRSASDLVIVE